MALRTTIGLLRVGSVRFAAYYFASFITALEAGSMASASWVGVAVLLCLLNCVGVELTNRWSDRVEDAVNQPHRTALCVEVGYRRIGLASLAIYAVLLLVYVAWYSIERNLTLLVVQVLSWFIGWNYSIGIRAKRYRIGVLLTLTSTFVMPFAFGWAMHSSFGQFPLSILVVPVFVISIAGLKDITDAEGDALRGYRSLFLDLVTQSRAVPLLLSPYVAVILLVTAGFAPPLVLILLLGMPLSLLFQRMARRARSTADRASVRELMYNFWLLFLLASLWTAFPNARVGFWLFGTGVFWWASSRWLHWQCLPTAVAMRKGIRLAF